MSKLAKSTRKTIQTFRFEADMTECKYIVFEVDGSGVREVMAKDSKQAAFRYAAAVWGEEGDAPEGHSSSLSIGVSFSEVTTHWKATREVKDGINYASVEPD
jgi:hypothetical protein